MKPISLIVAVLLILTGCSGDVARQVGLQNGAPVYQVFAKTRVPNGTAFEDIRDSAVGRSDRREAMRAMALSVCSSGYATLGPSEISASGWRRGEDGSAYNIELREMQSIVCS